METLTLSTLRSNGTNFGCLTDDEDHLVASAFGTTTASLRSHLTDYSRRTVKTPPISEDHWILGEMTRLFDGDKTRRSVYLRRDFTSTFQKEVYSWLGRIPRGKVTTYGMISRKLGSGPRAVGRAVASNPWPLFVECHRVVNADLTVGNYGLCGGLTQKGTATKRSLLQREGVSIKEDKIERAALWNPSEPTI